MACDRCLYLRIKHRFGTLDRTGGSRSFKRYGDGSLGNSGMDDPDSGMGIRTFLFTKHGIHDAGISGTPLQSSVTYHLIGHLTGKLCIDQGSSDSICRRTGIPASIRHQGTLGNRLLLDCRHRTGSSHCTIYDLRWYEIGTLYFCTSDSDSSVRFVDYPCARFQRTGRLGRNDESVRCCDGKRLW